MSKILRAELVGLFMEEAASYLPLIRQNRTAVAAGGATGALDELHRLFHTIKGAAAQVGLADLSQGARRVEDFLEELLEEGAPLNAEPLALLDRATELLAERIEASAHSRDEQQDFHERIAALFDGEAAPAKTEPAGTRALGQAVTGERQECLQAIRDVLPLLQELAGCLVPGGAEFAGHNARVASRLEQAVTLLCTTVETAGMAGPYQLLREFRLLLGTFRDQGLASQSEAAGLIRDFLQFFEAVLASGDPQNIGTVDRVTNRLQAVQALLGDRQAPWPPAEAVTAGFGLDEDIFAVPAADDDSVSLLDQLDESGLLEAQDLDFDWPEAPEDAAASEVAVAGEVSPQNEEQQLLLEIFRAECEEHLIVINSSLNSLEQQVEQPCGLTPDLRETLSGMRRAVHTLKGAAAMTGVNLLAQGAHTLEDLLDWLHDEAAEITPAEVAILATGIEVIELLSQSPEASGSVHLDRLVATIQGHLAEAAGQTAALDALPAPAAGGDPADEDLFPAAAPQEETPAGLPGESGFLRVRLDALDELIGIEGELVVARGAVEKMLDEFSQTLTEFDNVKENLRRKSQELEAGFEVKSLYGFNPAGPGMAGETAPSDFSEFDPIELDRYSQLNLIIRSLNEITVDINSVHATLALLASDIRGQVSKQQLTMRLMQDKLMRIRMTPMSSLSRMLFRTVRETARKLDKKVNLVISGEDVYMDRFVWARITDPLMHILRNAVDHGIEPVSRRLAANKPEVATISMAAEQHSRFVVLRVTDDGGGVDLERIKARLQRDGLVADPDGLSEQELLEYLFHPSFTTREDVSAISGRGVGLDVVRRNIQELRGSVQLRNRPGQGVAFEVQIPFSLSVNRAAIVSVAGRQYAVPLQDIQLVRRYSPAELETGDGLYLRFGAGLVAVASLGYYLQLAGCTESSAAGQGLLAIVFRKGEELRAVAIDEVVEQREIIVKNLGSHLTHVPGISGVTLTGSGELIPILNLRELVESRAVARGREEAVAPVELNAPLKVLIVDDSISVRHSVARLVESQAWKQQQAVDGVDALAKLAAFVPDVIVLDIEMPRMNGYEFKSNINNNAAYRDIPVIMLTSRTSDKHQQKARELGIHHYMTKPYQEAAFVRMLEHIRSGASVQG